MELDERKMCILKAVIDDYISTAVPVGSRTISSKYISGLSSATIRNEMSDLEELGYLVQPHVSAGRVPNAKAYRLYVDSMCEGDSLVEEESKRFREDFISRLNQLNDVAAGAAEALSDLTQYASVVMMPKQEELRINSLQLVPINRATALVVVVTDGGIFRDSILHVSDMIDHDGLYAISRILTERLQNKTLREAQEFLNVFVTNAPFEQQVLGGIADLAGKLERQSANDNLKLFGSHHMLQYPEYYDVDKARNVLHALREKIGLIDLLKDNAQSDFSVHIGAESGIQGMGDLSILTAFYEVGHGHRGAIGVVGPTRMPYPKVMNTLRIAGHALSEILTANYNN
ncbi:MAG: heat-inducible transcription repressor HrcA [Clostridiales bacterium]|nr:heat-inducible transcription repressor HrcA [Clostridiales bacterium]